jgi:hypothetical protein
MVFTKKGADLIENGLLMSGILFQVIAGKLNLTPIESVSLMFVLLEFITRDLLFSMVHMLRSPPEGLSFGNSS